ncbi:MAG: cytochrome C oxidase subunit IV family protein [Phycisphaerales bacterium]|nr:cytochrome C oxidase subunit IV family protein [Phycisphaerales bacterium]
MSNHDTTAHEEHAHGHPVVSWQMQLGVLLVLLFFTFTTVLFYNMESWVEHAFDIHLPGWVNIIGAMSIATVKALLVCMYFMGLRYDKALNTFALLFCLFCVALFLAFSMIDLQTRDRVDPWKKGEITLGGTGKALDAVGIDEDFSISPAPKINTQGMSIVEFRRQEKLEEKGSEKAFWKYYYKKHTDHRHPADESNYFAKLGYDHHEALPDANNAVPRAGLTPGLFDAVDPAEAAHDDDHSDDHADSDH